jgi:putative hydroxymethylpyrimidine transporter CytX
MESVRISFGRHGSLVFSISNIAQLTGWTAIMVFSGSVAAQYLMPQLERGLWCVVIGALIVVWSALGLRKMAKFQAIASGLLFVLTLLMCRVVFGDPGAQVPSPPSDPLSFGAAVELAAAMPLSWLPVVGDYTRRARKPLAGATSTTLAYTLGSCWMFVIGLGAALFAASADITAILAATGLGAGISTVVLSTVTTAFLDAESAGVSAQSIFPRANARLLGIGVAITGVVLAMFVPVAHFEGFLYLIGSVFAPMAAILAVDFFIFRNDASSKPASLENLALWAAGFMLYRISMAWDTPLGNTLPVLLIVAAFSCAVKVYIRKRQGRLAPGLAIPERNDRP